ncbi:MAG: hypothetical protein Q9159_007725 [Coniocarpon cinnabarinum]
MSPPTLYTFSGSGNSYKVRLLASLLGIDLRHEEIDFLKDEQHSSAFLKVNPRGEVPCLVDGDKTFNDSSSILLWLAGKYGDPDTPHGPSSYWSNDLYEQAQIVNWVSLFCILPKTILREQLGSIWYGQPPPALLYSSSYTCRFKQRLRTGRAGVFTNRAILSYNGPYNGLGNNQRWPQSKLDVFLEEGALRGTYSLKVLDQQLETRDWLALGRPTIADISVFVYVALAPMGDISLEPYPAVRAWIERIKKLRGFFGIEGLDDPLMRRR